MKDTHTLPILHTKNYLNYKQLKQVILGIREKGSKLPSYTYSPH